MAAKILEAKAVITAEDKASAVIAKLKQSFDSLAKSARGLGGKSALSGLAADVDKLARSAHGADALGRSIDALGRKAEAASRHMQKIEQRAKALKTIGTGLGLIAAHQGKVLGLKAIDAVGHFDTAARKQSAFTGVRGADQALLTAQARQIGQTTPFTNVEVVKAQTTAMQGPFAAFAPADKASMAAGVIESVKNYALVMGTDLTASAETIRSYLEVAGKDVSTAAKTIEESRKAVNQLAKMAKLSGMSGEDIQQFLNFGMGPAVAAGLKPETAMTLAELARRAGLHGDQAGVFMRATASKLVAPTREGLTALGAAGIDYSKYVTMPNSLPVDRLESHFKRELGKGFTDPVRAKLATALSNPAIIGDRGAFTKAVSDAVGEIFVNKKGKLDAASANRVAKAAGSFHKVSAQGVDTEGLLNSIFTSGMTYAQFNALVTSKHGGKAVVTEGQWNSFKTDREAIRKTGDDPNFAKNMADEIMGGVGGSVQKLTGSFDNLMLSIGQANEGLIKLGADSFAGLATAISNMDKGALETATAFIAVTAAVGGTMAAFTLLKSILGVGGPSVALTGSAAALDGAAAALTTAAAKLATLPGLIPAAATAAGGSAAWAGLGAAAGIAGGTAAARYVAAGNPLDIGLSDKESKDKRDRRLAREQSNNPGGSSGAQDAEFRRLADEGAAAARLKYAYETVGHILANTDGPGTLPARPAGSLPVPAGSPFGSLPMPAGSPFGGMPVTAELKGSAEVTATATFTVNASSSLIELVQQMKEIVVKAQGMLRAGSSNANGPAAGSNVGASMPEASGGRFGHN